MTWFSKQRVTKSNPPSQAPSPDAEALTRIAANVACVIPKSLDGRDLSVPNLVSHLVTAHRQQQHISQGLERERNVLEQEKVTLEGKIQANQAELRTREDKHHNEISRLNDIKEQLRQDCEQEKATLQGTIQASQAESQTQKAEWNNREHQYLNEIIGIKDAQERLRKDCEETIGRIGIQHTNNETALGARYKEGERRMREEHERAARKSENVIQSLQKHAEKRENDFKLEKMQLEEAHRFKQDELKEHFKAHESQLKQAHKEQQERLQKDIQSRNKALIARENYSPITDGELKSMFSGLVREVDALARLKWTSNRSPWSDELLSQISDTTKRLQKQILKDTIWDILFEHVFCSPFRVFGKEGSVLESQWNKAFGKDPKTGNDHYIWPEPSFDAERWRYETMKQSQEALKIDTSEYDPRTKLWKGFQSSMKTICEKLGGMLEMVSKIDEKTEQTMEEIAEKAAKMCVAFGTQRCRIFVVIKDLKTTDEVKEGPDRQDKLVELLMQPELRRIGDADGQSLDKEQTVSGCEGEIKKILY